MYNIKKPTIWFFQTVDERNESGIPRMRLLPGQYVPIAEDPEKFEPGDTTLNTQSQTAPRTSNPIGTVFAIKLIKKQKTVSGTAYYTCDKSPVITVSTAATAEITGAYKEYMAQMGGAMPEAFGEPEEAPATLPGGLTLIDKLIKENPRPTVADDGFYVNEEVWRLLLFNTHQGYNTMLVGQSGCGKTELTMLLGKSLKKDVKIFDMAAKQDPIASLIGIHRFDEKSVFDRADFTYALETNGIVVLDELPRAPMNTNNILFPILDSRRELCMDIASGGLRSIKVNGDCRFIATANEGFEYTGNNVLDRALKERFQIILIEYMPNHEEVALLVKRTGVTKKNAEVIVKAATQVRSLHSQDELSSAVSIRHTLYASDMCAAGFKLANAMENAFLPMYIIEDERIKVKDLLAGR